jgi:hypothetical protein
MKSTAIVVWNPKDPLQQLLDEQKVRKFFEDTLNSDFFQKAIEQAMIDTWLRGFFVFPDMDPLTQIVWEIMES